MMCPPSTLNKAYRVYLFLSTFYCHLIFALCFSKRTTKILGLRYELWVCGVSIPRCLALSDPFPVQLASVLYDKSFSTSQKHATRNNVQQIKVNTEYWMPSPNTESKKYISHCKMLAKFRLTSLVVLTAMGGYAIAPQPFVLSTFLLCSLGTGLVSAAANSMNQYHEVPFDSQMSRTKNRVLVTGQLTPLHAIGFTVTCASIGLSMLYFGVNGLTAALGLGNFILYTSVYTPLKRTSIVNTWVGSIVGAIPPLMGWAGCSGNLEMGAWVLAGLLYAWQFPHFNALSWNLRPDYSRAGYRMMAVTNPDLCRRTALRYTVVITVLSLLAPLCNTTSVWFALESLPINVYFTYLAYKFYRNSDSGSSRKLFRFSLLHLPVLMLLFLFNKKEWIFTDHIPNKETGDVHLVKNIMYSSTNVEKKDTLLQSSLVSSNRNTILPLKC